MRRRRGIMGLNGGAGIPVITATATGNPMTFETDMIKPLKSLVIPFTPIQAAGTPSPENPLPISGWTGCNIYNDSQYAELIYFNQIRADSAALVSTDGIKTSVTNGVLRIENVSRTSNYSSGSSRNEVSPFNAISGHKYALVGSSDKNTTGVAIIIADNKEYYYTLNQIFTAPKSGNIKYRINKTYDFVNTHPIGDVTNIYINLFDLTEMFGAGNEPSTFSDFVALFPNEHYAFNSGEYMTVSAANEDDHSVNVSWSDTAGTVYGGTLTLHEDGSADLVSNWQYGIVSELWPSGWTYISNVTTPYFEHNTNVNVGLRESSLCSMYKYALPSGANMPDLSFGVISNGTRIRIRNSNYTTVNAFMAAMADVYIAFPLVDSSISIKTYHFDDIGQLTTFLGTNNIWTDTNGTNTATYLKHQS